jgi:hypothetical protein
MARGHWLKINLEFACEDYPGYCAYACVEMIIRTFRKNDCGQSTMATICNALKLSRHVALENLLTKEYKFHIKKTMITNSGREIHRIRDFEDVDRFVSAKSAMRLIQKNIDRNIIQIAWLDTTHLPGFFKEKHLHPTLIAGLDAKFIYLNDPAVGEGYPYSKAFVLKALQWVYEVRR